MGRTSPDGRREIPDPEPPKPAMLRAAKLNMTPHEIVLVGDEETELNEGSDHVDRLLYEDRAILVGEKLLETTGKVLRKYRQVRKRFPVYDGEKDHIPEGPIRLSEEMKDGVLVVGDGEGLPPEDTTMTGTIGGIGVVYVVPKMVALAHPQRKDFVVPYPLVRDDDGRIVGCRGLVRVRVAEAGF